jgi:hypothetical protein
MTNLSIETMECVIFPLLPAGTRRLSVLLAACGSLLMGLAMPAAAQTIAIITDLTGKASIQGAATKRDVTILSVVDAGTRLSLDGGAHMVALYTASGDEYAFAGPALIEFRNSAPEALSGSQPQKRTSAVATSANIRIKTSSTMQAGYVMRSLHDAAHIKMLSPAGSKTLEVSPEFRWQDVQPGVKYQFALTDETGKSLYETEVESAALKLPASVPLKEGAAYTWQVSVRLADGHRYVSIEDFSIATAELRERVAALRPATDAPVSERVAYAAWLDQEELKDEARKYWRAVAAERPEDARLRELAAE